MAYEIQKEQEQNTDKLVMNAFYKIASQDGVSASEITKYLQEKFGNVWRVSVLTSKAEETLNRSAALGFLGKRGDRYVANLARGLRCRTRRRRRSCRPRRSKRCRRRRRRRCCCG